MDRDILTEIKTNSPLGAMLQLELMSPQPIYPMKEYLVHAWALHSAEDLEPHQEIDMPDWVIKVEGADVRYKEIDGLWYFYRPAFFNNTHPLYMVKEVLGVYDVLDGRQMGILANMINYAHNNPSGLDGHNGYLIAEKLFVLIAFMLPRLGDDDMMDVLVNYKIWQDTL